MSDDPFDKLKSLYSQMPKTIGCVGCGKCCKVQHPHCYVTEFYYILKGISDWSIKEIADLHVACIANYFDNSMNKPCVFLSEDNKCRIYDYRDYNCRAFGIIPKKEYAKRVKSIKKKFPGQKLGLEKQSDCCGDVHPEVFIGANKLDKIFSDIRDLDHEINVPEEEIEDGNNYMTFHDHYLLYYYRDNPEFLKKLTYIKNNCSDSEKNSFIDFMDQFLKKKIGDKK